MLGHIPISRLFLELPFYTEDKALKLFFHCLMRANYSRQKWKGRYIQRGQFVTSFRSLARELDWSNQAVRTQMKKLEKYGELTHKSTQQYTVITVCNYNSYVLEQKKTNTLFNTLSNTGQKNTQKTGKSATHEITHLNNCESEDCEGGAKKNNTRLTHEKPSQVPCKSGSYEGEFEKTNTDKEVYSSNNTYKKTSKKENRQYGVEEIRQALEKHFGKNGSQVANIVKGFYEYSGILLDETFVLMQRAEFLFLDFSKYNYRIFDDYKARECLFRFLNKNYQRSERGRNTDLRSQNDFEKYMDEWLIQTNGVKEGKFKAAYRKKKGITKREVSLFKEKQENVITIYKKHFTDYPNLTIFTLFEVLYLDLWTSSKKNQKNMYSNVHSFLNFLKKESKTNSFHMNKTHMRTNIIKFKQKQTT